MAFRDAAFALVETGRRLDARGWAPATAGNYSARLDDGSFAITVSGRHKGRLVVGDIMRVDGAGRALTPGKPSAETELHLALYRAFPEANAVLHGHSPEAVGLSRAVPDATEWVFPDAHGRPFRRDRVGKVFRKASRGAGLKDFHFHDLRHHGATMALNRGFSGPIVMALGGWKTERMMRRSAAVTDATLRAAAEAVAGDETSRRIGEIVTP